MNSIQKQIQASSFNAVSLIRKLHPTLVAQSIVGVQPMSGTSGRSVFFAPYIPKSMYKSKYNFSRARWYVAEFDTRNYEEVVEWCTEHFGPRPKQSDAWTRWVHTYEDKIHFRDKKDYTWFVLRWT